MAADGHSFDEELVSCVSPYLTEHINRFGVYPTDDLHIKPQAFDPELANIDFAYRDIGRLLDEWQTRVQQANLPG